jgi:hypothetical protein
MRMGMGMGTGAAGRDMGIFEYGVRSSVASLAALGKSIYAIIICIEFSNSPRERKSVRSLQGGEKWFLACELA